MRSRLRCRSPTADTSANTWGTPYAPINAPQNALARCAHNSRAATRRSSLMQLTGGISVPVTRALTCDRRGRRGRSDGHCRAVHDPCKRSVGGGVNALLVRHGSHAIHQGAPEIGAARARVWREVRVGRCCWLAAGLHAALAYHAIAINHRSQCSTTATVQPTTYQALHWTTVYHIPGMSYHMACCAKPLT
jgi:hypothetical protein